MDEFISGSFVLHNFSFVVQTNMYEPRKSLERTGRGGSVVFSYLLVVWLFLLNIRLEKDDIILPWFFVTDCAATKYITLQQHSLLASGIWPSNQGWEKPRGISPMSMGCFCCCCCCRLWCVCVCVCWVLNIVFSLAFFSAVPTYLALYLSLFEAVCTRSQSKREMLQKSNGCKLTSFQRYWYKYLFECICRICPHNSEPGSVVSGRHETSWVQLAQMYFLHTHYLTLFPSGGRAGGGGYGLRVQSEYLFPTPNNLCPS